MQALVFVFLKKSLNLSAMPLQEGTSSEQKELPPEVHEIWLLSSHNIFSFLLFGQVKSYMDWSPLALFSSAFYSYNPDILLSPMKLPGIYCCWKDYYLRYISVDFLWSQEKFLKDQLRYENSYMLLK